MKHEPMRQLTEADFAPQSNPKADGYTEAAWDCVKAANDKLTFAYKCFLEAANAYEAAGQHYKASRSRKLAQSLKDAANSLG